VVFVLHVFRKKSKFGVETPRLDMSRIAERLKHAARLAKEM
jgi:phage-related protein